MKTLFFRTLFAVVAALLIFVVFLASFLFLGFDRSLDSWKEDKLREISESVEEILLNPDLLIEASFPVNIPVFIYSLDKELIYSSRGEGRQRSFPNVNEAIRLSVDGRPIGYYHVGNIAFMNDIANQQFIASMGQVLLIGALSSCILAGIYALIFSRGLAGPAKTVAAGIRRIAGGNLEEEIPERGAEEISLIAGAANDLRKQLLRERLLRTQWAEDITHDLRTPISALKAQFEGMLDGVLPINEIRIERNIGEIHRVEKLIKDLQELMGLENPEMDPNCAEVVVDELIRNIVTTFSYDAEKQHISISAPPSGLRISADEDLIHRALSNIMSNALRHTHTGGTIELFTLDTGDYVALSVKNTGDIIPESELEKVFDRLFRGDHARTSPGSGLGLTIARRIAELHRGTIGISSTPESGTIVEIRLPR